MYYKAVADEVSYIGFIIENQEKSPLGKYK
jgi:hypothetical protein